MAQVLKTPAARRDLREIARYISHSSGSREIAIRFIDTIVARCNSLAETPHVGEVCEDLGQRVQRFTVGSYVLFYRPIKDGIQLLRVLHGAREMPSAWRRKK